MVQSVEYINNDGFMRYADYTEKSDGSGHLPVTRYQNGQVVSNQGDAVFAATYTMLDRYADGAIHTYTVKNADGSRIQLVFDDPGSSPTSDNSVTFGLDNQVHGKLTDSLYVSPSTVPGGSAFSIGEHFEDGHLTKYALKTADNQASLIGNYDTTTHAADLSLVTVNGSVSTSGFGQIDALLKINGARLIGQDGNGFISDHGAAFSIVSDNGNGLISQDGKSWSVVSNDGGTFSLIGQDGNGLNQLNIASLIGQDGNGIAATVEGNIVAQGGGNIVAQGGGNIDWVNLGTSLGQDTVQLLESGTDGINGSALGSLQAGDPRTDLGDFMTEALTGIRSLKALTDNVVDLTVPAAFLDHTDSGAPYHYGDTLTVSWQVSNVGPGDSLATTSQIYLSTDGSVSGDDKLIGSFSDLPVTAGTSFADNFDYVIPSDLAPGTYYIYVVANAVEDADPAKNTVEDRTNNISGLLSFTVESASSVPDLTVPLVLLDKESGHVGDTVNVSWQVKETANVDAGASTSRVYISSDMTIDSSDELLSTRFQPAIAAGNGSGDMVDVTVPTDLAPGTYYIGVVADSDGDVSETDEANNIAWTQFTVLADTATPTIAFDPITGDDLVSRADLAGGVEVTGTTKDVEDGRIITFTLEKLDGTVIGTATATVENGTFSVNQPKVKLPLNGPAGTLFVDASVTNAAGHSAEISHYTMAYDLTPPGIAVVNANVTKRDGGYSFDVLGTVDSVTGTSVHIFSGNTDLGQVGIDSQHHWSYGAFVHGKSAHLTVEAIDTAGNTTTLGLLDISTKAGISTGSGDDTLTGDAKANVLNGLDGNDQLTGGGGADRLIGGAGEDSASYDGSTKGVVASLFDSGDNTNEAKGDTYSSIEDLRGSQFGDMLVGDNQLNFLYGGSGGDKFVFSAFNKGTDAAPDGIYDFSEADHDKILLDHKIFTKLHIIRHELIDPHSFKDIGSTTAKVDDGDRILYNSFNGELFYDRDGSGKAHAVAFAYLTNLAHLSASDFVVI